METILNIEPGILHWLIVSALLFSIGLFGVLTRKSAIGILVSIELMLNSAALNFLVFNRFIAPAKVEGELMAIFIIAVAAAEAVVAMAIFVALFRQRKTIDVTQMNLMKG
ncbi:NADH-quinone oxidoreductase subunit NuoK [Bdellovibrionota bacterium]